MLRVRTHQIVQSTVDSRLGPGVSPLPHVTAEGSTPQVTAVCACSAEPCCPRRKSLERDPARRPPPLLQMWRWCSRQRRPRYRAPFALPIRAMRKSFPQNPESPPATHRWAPAAVPDRPSRRSVRSARPPRDAPGPDRDAGPELAEGRFSGLSPVRRLSCDGPGSGRQRRSAGAWPLTRRA